MYYNNDKNPTCESASLSFLSLLFYIQHMHISSVV